VKVLVGGEHRQLVTNAEFRQQSVDCSYLYTLSAARITLLGSLNMVVSIRNE
jgi:hypothetical protein